MIVVTVRKRPIVIEAALYDDNTPIYELVDWGVVGKFELGVAGTELWIWNDLEQCYVRCPKGHWVLRGLKGEFYPCDPDVFDSTYEMVSDDDRP